jgi:enoyl-CoA hydratase
MEYETILLTKAGGVATITLNRPEVLNAMSFQLIGELDQAITDVEADDEVGAVIITGAGERAFSAGADIHEQRRDVQEISTEEIEERRAIRSEYS